MREIELLKKLKEEKGLSYEKIARDLEVSFNTVYRWLAYNKPPRSMVMVNRIQDYLKRKGVKL